MAAAVMEEAEEPVCGHRLALTMTVHCRPQHYIRLQINAELDLNTRMDYGAAR